MSDSDDEEQAPVPIEVRDTEKGKGKLLRGQTPRQVGAIFKTKLPPLLSARQHAAAKAKEPAPVRCLSRMTVADDFEMAHCVLRIRWQECNESHLNKLQEASNDTKTKLPITKDQLEKNLVRKMSSFAKIINKLPMMNIITRPMIRSKRTSMTLKA